MILPSRRRHEPLIVDRMFRMRLALAILCSFFLHGLVLGLDNWLRKVQAERGRTQKEQIYSVRVLTAPEKLGLKRMGSPKESTEKE